MTVNDELREGMPRDRLMSILASLPEGAVLRINRNMLLALIPDGDDDDDKPRMRLCSLDSTGG